MGLGSSQEVEPPAAATALEPPAATPAEAAPRPAGRAPGGEASGAEAPEHAAAPGVAAEPIVEPNSAAALCGAKGIAGGAVIDPGLGVRAEDFALPVESNNAEELTYAGLQSEALALGANASAPARQGPCTVEEMLAMPSEDFLEACAQLFNRFDRDKDGALDRKEFERLAHAFVLAFGMQAPEDARLSEWLAARGEALRAEAARAAGPPPGGDATLQAEPPMSPEAFAAFARRVLRELCAQGHGAVAMPSAGLTAAMECGHSLHGVRLDGSQFFRLPEGVPLRVLVGMAAITDRWLEPNEELLCEVRVYPARNPLSAYLFSESAHAGAKATEATRGEVAGEAGRVSWLFGEELTFEGEAVGQERRADGALQAQIWVSRPSGEKVASTTLFPVPTEKERNEPLWTRTLFSKRIGHISVVAGWVGPELVGWLAGEVLRRASFGRWSWVVETLSAMGPLEVQDMAASSWDEEGRRVLTYAAMSGAVEPSAAEVVDMLLKARVDPSTADLEGLTAVHYAAFAGADASLAALLKAGADPNAVAEGGVTPLMLAGLSGSLVATHILLDAGAVANAIDANGLTAACWICLGCGEPPSRSGRPQLLNNGPEEARAVAQISRGLHEAIDRRRSRTLDLWGGPDRRELLGQLTERLYKAAPLSEASSGSVERIWLPLVREAARPGPVRCGCFAELYTQLQRLQGLRIPILSSVLHAAIAEGDQSEEQLCRMLLRECGELPVSGSLPDGRTLTEAALDLGWDEVAILLCDRGAVLDTDFAGQARALRAAVEGGHKELARRLVGQWAEARDAWSRPALPAAEGLAECPVCFSMLCESPGALFTEQGRRACQHLLCLTCATELAKQSQGPKCPICRHQFKPPAQRLPDPREDPCGWFAFFDEGNAGYLDRHLLEKVLPAVVPVDAGRLETALRGELWNEWDPAGEGRISRAAFCAERGLLRWLAEHLAELQEDRARGQPPAIENDREGWFRHWARPGASEMGKGEVLRAVLKSAGTSSLEAAAVAASREWIERCWLMWDRGGNGKISLADFCTEGGFADMMLRQSALAAAKRVVRRMELEHHHPAVLVACCQQLVECAVGVLPEDPVSRWPERAMHKLNERATLPVREEYEATLAEGVVQVVAAIQRNQGSTKLFAWGCRALVALSFAPLESRCPPPEAQSQILDALLGLTSDSVGPLRSSGAPISHLRDCSLWRLVVQGFVHLLPEQAVGTAKPSRESPAPAKAVPPQALSPGALREAGLCAVAVLRVLAERSGPSIGDEIYTSLAAALSGRGGDGCEASAEAAGGSLTGLTSWIQNALGLDGGGAPSAALITWCSATVVSLAADTRLIAETLLSSAPAPSFVPWLGGLLAALGAGLETRPPTTAKAAGRLVHALLTGLRKLPAGGGVGKPSPPPGDASAAGDAPARPRIRDGRIAVGDAVRLNPDLAKARREQDPAEHFGGWCDRMAFCLDFPGRVVEIPRRAPRMPEVLRISHGAMGCWCWNVSVVTEVIPDAGLLPFEEGEGGPGVALTIGDEVRIGVNVEEAKRLQVNHGGWNDRMSHCCGKAGRLEAIDKAGDMKVLVPGVGAFVWNPAALRAPHAQRWEAALCERLAGPLDGVLPLAVLAALLALGNRLDDIGLRSALRDVSTSLPQAASGDEGRHCTSWVALVTAALLVNPRLAVTAVLQEDHLPFQRVARVPSLAVCSQDFPGLSNLFNAEEGLLQLVEAWWSALPPSERRARGI